MRFCGEYDAFFRLSDWKEERKRELICDGVYYDIPAYHSLNRAFSAQIELSGEFWKLALEPAATMAEKVKTACRIYDCMLNCSEQMGCG